MSKQVTVLCEKIWDSNYLYLHSDQVLSILSNWKYLFDRKGRAVYVEADTMGMMYDSGYP